MDLITLLIGVVIGIIVGFALAWFWVNSSTNTHSASQQSNEEELKTLMAQQAESHLQTSRDTIQSIEFDLANLRNSVAEYEKSLTPSNQDFSQTTFFGEHASMFLRNADSQSELSKTVQQSDNQPKDFANSGSGVFVGSTEDKLEEKSNN